MKRKTLDDKIPIILRQRLLINDEHRTILKAMEELSPRDTGFIYIPGRNGREVPSVDMIAKETGLSEDAVRKNIQKIKKIWNISDNLPTNNGWFTKEEALISSLTNQHKLRWDTEINDYRVPRINMYSAEIGTGTLYTRNKAFEGEKILRKAIGLDKMLNSYVIQGGIMPQIIALYGKLKAERASLIGLNKTGEETPESKVEQLKSYLELAQKNELSPKENLNLETFVINTLNSMPEAARSVSHELVPLLENIPKNVPIHFFWSYNDDFNMEEIGDILIARMRLIHKKAKEAEERLPKLKEDISQYKSNIAQLYLNTSVAEHIKDYFSEIDDIPSGKKLRTTIEEKLFHEENGNISPGLKKFKKMIMKGFTQHFGREGDFERVYSTAKQRFFYENAVITDISVIESRITLDKAKKDKIEEKLPGKEDEIAELEHFYEAFVSEESEGHSWFTKKIAINPTESKAHRMIKKENYKKIWTDYLLDPLKKMIGDKKFFLHTDREISIFIPDPSLIWNKNEYPSNKLYGTILTSIPRTNRQRSNEPLLNSLAELQKKHESAIASRLKFNKERPKTIEEFDKHNASAFSDILMTSWGAEGERVMPKIVVAPSRVKGDYRDAVETVYYFKSPSRHDTGILSELVKKGNRGTWEAKRIDKGGPTTGNTIQITHPDRSQEWIFIDDSLYEKIEYLYSGRIKEVEDKIVKTKGKLTRSRVDNSKKKWKKDIKNLNGQLKNINNEIADMSGLYKALLANDDHFGAYNEKGCPNNVDYVRASQLIALQSYGFDNIDVVTGTEFLHGIQAFRAHDTRLEGLLENPVESDFNTHLLERGLRERFLTLGMNPLKAEQEVLRYLNEYKNEQMHSKSTFRPNDQIDMFKLVEQPVFDELLANNTPIYVGSGNHWKNSVKDIDEARLIKDLFPLKYERKGLMNAIPADGQSYTIHPIRLPSMKGHKINAMFAHKMWHGNTEISALSKQAQGHREDAQIYLVADRHHPGMVVERDKFFVLDTGKQTTMDYVSIIGKVSSTRGTMVVGYSPTKEQIFSTRFFLDDVVDKVIGWPEKAQMLKTCHDTLNQKLKTYDKV